MSTKVADSFHTSPVWRQDIPPHDLRPGPSPHWCGHPSETARQETRSCWLRFKVGDPTLGGGVPRPLWIRRKPEIFEMP